MIYGLLGIIIIVLIILLIRKHNIDLSKEYEERHQIQSELNRLHLEREHLEDILDQRDEAIQKADKAYREAIEQYTKEYPYIRIIDNPDKVVPHAMNRGIMASKGDVIIRLDAHAVYPTYYFSKLIKYFS